MTMSLHLQLACQHVNNIPMHSTSSPEQFEKKKKKKKKKIEFQILKISFSSSSYSKKMCGGQGCSCITSVSLFPCKFPSLFSCLWNYATSKPKNPGC